MKRTYSVYLGAHAGASVEVEMDDSSSVDEIYDAACKKASLSDATASDWDGTFEIMDEEGVCLASDIEGDYNG